MSWLERIIPARPPRPTRSGLLILAALVAAAVAVGVVLRALGLDDAGVLTLVWAVPAGWMLGARAGLAAGVAGLVLDVVLTRTGVNPGPLRDDWPGLVAGLLVPPAAGAARSLVEKMQAQAAQLEAARVEAIRASQAKSAFLARMSHELRTPLASILGYAELLQEEARDGAPEALDADLNRITQAARHLMALVEDLLDLTRIEAQQLTLTFEPFSPAAMAADAAELIRPLAEAGGNQLVLEVERAPERLVSDQRRFKQVLLNLAGNAAKFTRQGTVTVIVERAPRGEVAGLALRVKDTGPGMTPEEQRRLFEEFYQAPRARASGKGTGLGLAISRRLCELLGGTLEVASAPGEGSTFTAWFPSVESAVAFTSGVGQSSRPARTIDATVK
ncbi:MAG: HAMP domain-containing sensor histidine kinase [Anaeromyxobacter sp.]